MFAPVSVWVRGDCVCVCSCLEAAGGWPAQGHPASRSPAQQRQGQVQGGPAARTWDMGA